MFSIIISYENKEDEALIFKLVNILNRNGYSITCLSYEFIPFCNINVGYLHFSKSAPFQVKP